MEHYYAQPGSLMEVNEPFIDETRKCPALGKQVVGENWRYTSSLSGKVMWWQCPACRGWHTLLVNLSENSFTQADRHVKNII